jgi:GPI ethanolamine phosphate transferase 3 subunit O
MQALRSGLVASPDWDILVGHYLGVDHAGHTFCVQSPQMLQKVQQMDREVIEVRCWPGHSHAAPPALHS